jgi:hypothetical protein
MSFNESKNFDENFNDFAEGVVAIDKEMGDLHR